MRKNIVRLVLIVSFAFSFRMNAYYPKDFNPEPYFFKNIDYSNYNSNSITLDSLKIYNSQRTLTYRFSYNDDGTLKTQTMFWESTTAKEFEYHILYKYDINKRLKKNEVYTTDEHIEFYDPLYIEEFSYDSNKVTSHHFTNINDEKRLDRIFYYEYYDYKNTIIRNIYAILNDEPTPQWAYLKKYNSENQLKEYSMGSGYDKDEKIINNIYDKYNCTYMDEKLTEHKWIKQYPNDNKLLFKYNYDAEGNITERIDYLRDNNDELQESKNGVNYYYDDIDMNTVKHWDGIYDLILWRGSYKLKKRPLEVKYYKLEDGFKKDSIHAYFYYSDIESSVSDQIKNELTVYPNPADDFIEIYLDGSHLEGGQHLEIAIYDVLGNKVFNSTFNTLTPAYSPREREHRIDVSQLPKGVYFVKIGNITEKFVKM